MRRLSLRGVFAFGLDRRPLPRRPLANLVDLPIMPAGGRPAKNYCIKVLSMTEQAGSLEPEQYRHPATPSGPLDEARFTMPDRARIISACAPARTRARPDDSPSAYCRRFRRRHGGSSSPRAECPAFSHRSGNPTSPARSAEAAQPRAPGAPRGAVRAQLVRNAAMLARPRGPAHRAVSAPHRRPGQRRRSRRRSAARRRRLARQRFQESRLPRRLFREVASLARFARRVGKTTGSKPRRPRAAAMRPSPPPRSVGLPAPQANPGSASSR